MRNSRQSSSSSPTRFALPLSRIGVEGGQSLFRRFQAKTRVNERTRSAEEILAAVRGELQAFRDSTHLGNLQTLAKQEEQTASAITPRCSPRTVDESLDRDELRLGLGKLLEALVDPLPELRPDAELSPRNLVTSCAPPRRRSTHGCASPPNTSSSDAARARVRELETSIEDQQLIADTHAASRCGAAARGAGAGEGGAAAAGAGDDLRGGAGEQRGPRGGARSGDGAARRRRRERASRSCESCSRNSRVRSRRLREALETRRAWLWQQLIIAIAGVAAIYGIGFGWRTCWSRGSAVRARAFAVMTAFAT